MSTRRRVAHTSTRHVVTAVRVHASEEGEDLRAARVGAGATRVHAHAVHVAALADTTHRRAGAPAPAPAWPTATTILQRGPYIDSLPATWHTATSARLRTGFGLTPRRGAAAAVLQARLAAPIAAPLLHTGRPAALATTHPAAHAAAPLSRGPGLLTPCAPCPLRHSRALCAGGWRDGFLLPRAACERVRLSSSPPPPPAASPHALDSRACARIGAASARSKQSSRG